MNRFAARVRAHIASCVRAFCMVALGLAAIPLVAKGQACVGSLAGPGQAALRVAAIGPSAMEILRAEEERNVEVAGSVHLPQRVWAEAGWGRRTERHSLYNPSDRLYGGIGYSLEKGRDSLSFCPFGQITHEGDNIFGNRGALLRVHPRTVVRFGAAAGRRIAAGGKSHLVPFAALSQGFWLDIGASATLFDVGLTAGSDAAFLLSQFGVVTDGSLAAYEFRFGGGIIF